MNTIKSTVSGLGMLAIFAVALVMTAPVVHAQWDDTTGFVGDGGGCCSVDTTSTFVDTYTPSNYTDTIGYVSPSDYSTPSYASSPYSGYSNYGSGSGCSSCGGGSRGYSSTPYYSGGGYSAPNYYPAHQPSSAPSYTTTTVANNGNTTDSNNSCVHPGSCSTDDHSVVNANTTISTPTTVTISNANPTYYPPATVAQPTYYPAPVQQPAYYQAPLQQPIYRNPVPYVTLSQVPYTGLDLGPIGLVFYWSFLVLACLAMAYVIVVKRAHYRLASALKGFLFGTEEEEEETEQIEIAPIQTSITPQPKAVGYNDEIDEFVMSQINRARA